MKKPCTQCSHLTKRSDLLCMNCYTKEQKGLHQSIAENCVISTFKYVCACGESDPYALILMEQYRLGAIPPRNNSPKHRDDRALLASHEPDIWFARCYNCQQDLYNGSPGRPPKYKTHEEREFVRKNRTKIYLANLQRKVIQSYGIDGVWPSCVMCDSPATRVLFIGEFGKAPVGNQYIYCRRLALVDYHWHNQFAPYCDSHEVSNIGLRGKEHRRIWREKAAEAMNKSTRDIFALSL